MTKQDLMDALNQAGLIDADGNIVLRAEDITPQCVDPQTFWTFFADVADDVTYETLSGSHTFQWGDPPQSVTRTAVELGYQPFFDAWKAAGIIS
jgi:oxalate decarboxylase/phosphoglucose isomerase-like protein (cupin superfamily)